MNDLKKDAGHWSGKIAELIKVIYQVKDGALESPFGVHAKWHAKLSNDSCYPQEMAGACKKPGKSLFSC
jgi:hypothetical protein